MNYRKISWLKAKELELNKMDWWDEACFSGRENGDFYAPDAEWFIPESRYYDHVGTDFIDITHFANQSKAA